MQRFLKPWFAFFEVQTQLWDQACLYAVLNYSLHLFYLVYWLIRRLLVTKCHACLMTYDPSCLLDKIWQCTWRGWINPFNGVWNVCKYCFVVGTGPSWWASGDYHWLLSEDSDFHWNNSSQDGYQGNFFRPNEGTYTKFTYCIGLTGFDFKHRFKLALHIVLIDL